MRAKLTVTSILLKIKSDNKRISFGKTKEKKKKKKKRPDFSTEK